MAVDGLEDCPDRLWGSSPEADGAGTDDGDLASESLMNPPVKVAPAGAPINYPGPAGS
jgi:hypothetical protein